ncbi:MAG: hypothetical protein SGJ02_02420 [bacterium]|nr:hypothetical protein [bacterium]
MINFDSHKPFFSTSVLVGALLTFFFFAPTTKQITVKEYDSKILVSDDEGKTEAHYGHNQLIKIRIHPLMRQRYGIGAPKGAVVSSLIYYITEEELANRRKTFDPAQGCFGTYLPNQMHELLIVGDKENLSSFINYQVPELKSRESVVTLEGYFLWPMGLTENKGVLNSGWSKNFSADKKLFYIKSVKS